MNPDQEKIISFLKFNGPVLPAQVAKHINSNILLASAHLSELSSQGKVKTSKLKVGGSPLYLLPEHKNKLQDFIHNLNPKDQNTVTLIKDRKILKEKNLDLLTRVSLRNLKDFAVPLNITINQNRELFWKWFLLTDQQALDLVKSQFSPSPPSPPPPEPEIQSQLKPQPETIETLETSETPPPPTSSPEPPKETLPPEHKTAPSPEPKTLSKSVQKPGPKKSSEEKKPFFQKLKEKIKPKRREVPDTFFPQIDSFFQERDIKIESKDTLRKNSEMNFILKVPSVIGQLTYFCEAKNKKR